MDVKCHYCGENAKLVTGETVYPHRPDLAYKRFYLCDNEGHEVAYVGCHESTNQPFGILANAVLRAKKSEAHRSFDVIWKDGHLSRSKAYAWLGGVLKLSSDECHIGKFDEAMCDEAVRVCNNFIDQRGF